MAQAQIDKAQVLAAYEAADALAEGMGKSMAADVMFVHYGEELDRQERIVLLGILKNFAAASSISCPGFFLFSCSKYLINFIAARDYTPCGCVATIKNNIFLPLIWLWCCFSLYINRFKILFK